MSLAGLKYYLGKRGGWIDYLISRHLLDWVPDEPFLKLKFRQSLGESLDLEHPQTYNEKIQWLKLYDRDPLYPRLVDKYEVRSFIAEKLGPEYSIPLVGGPWDSPEEIDFDALPDQFVLKCTHDSGGLIICRDKSALDREQARSRLSASLARNYYWSKREWPYKDVPPRIIAEQYMQDGDTRNLNVYKILNFGGTPRIIQTIQNDKTREESIDYFDTDWNLLDLRQGFPNSEVPLPRPKTLPDMLRAAAVLSAGFPTLRTDFYEINGRAYFSEITFYTDSGLCPFEPPSWDALLGSWTRLPIDEEES